MRFDKKTILSYIIIPLMVGLVGSAMYDYLIAPLSSLLIESLSKYSSKISNYIYGQIPYGAEDLAVLIPIRFCVLALYFLSVLMFIFYKRFPMKYSFVPRNRAEQVYVKLRSRRLLSCSVLFLTIAIMMTVSVEVLTYTSYTKTTVLQNIEIISPYISDVQYKKLRSDFYLIQNKHDFELVTNNIQSFASQNSITLKNKLP